MEEKSRIIVVSNRLPLILKKTDDGKTEAEKGVGGLVTAMAPVLKNRNGIWIGWPGYVQKEDVDDSMLSAIHSAGSGYNVKSVMLSSEELRNY
jgi:trehalose-6-phosphate synthase